MKRRMGIILLALAVVFSMMPSISFAATDKVREAYEKTGDVVYDAVVKAPVYDAVWQVIGLARSDHEKDKGAFEGYYESLVNRLAENNGQLHKVKYTEYSRAILAVTAIGRDVKNVGGYNLLSYLTDMDKVSKQGVNGPIWALIALDSGNYETEGTLTRAALIEKILSDQTSDGGWDLSKRAADPDMTAMAIQALAPYYNKDKAVKSAVDKALETLSLMQKSDGSFASWGTVNSESISQVIVALTSLGINPCEDTRFIKSGKNPVDALITFYTGKGFKHVITGDTNSMATEQGYYALVSYYRLLDNKTSLYDMTDVEGVTVTKPAKAVISSLKSTKKGTAKISWKKVDTAKGYEVSYALSGKKAKVLKTSSLSKTVKSLKSKKTYTFKVRAYKTVNGKTVYGPWSGTKKIKVK